MFRVAVSGCVRTLRRALFRSALQFPCMAFAGTLAAAGADGVLPPQGGEETTPVVFGAPPGCAGFIPYALNNASYPRGLVITGFADCGNGRRAYAWRNGSWQELELPQSNSPADGFGGDLYSVANDHPTMPTMTLVVSNEVTESAWVTDFGQTPVALPAPNRYHAESALVASRGDYVVGSLQYEPGGQSEQAVRWSRTPDGWSLPELIALGIPAAVSADGSVVAGNGHPSDYSAWVWSVDSGESWLLGQGSDVQGMTHDGSMVVGSRQEPCTVHQCNVHQSPVYWTPGGGYGAWLQHDLPLPEWFGVDNPSAAVAVADVDGMAVIVGNLWAIWQGEVNYPVAWFPLPDGSYAEPVVLTSPGGEDYVETYIRDINRNGVVIGAVSNPLDAPAQGVLWQLVDPSREAITAWHSGAWFDPVTPGQGILLDVEPADQSLFLGWFTFTPPGTAGGSEQHWYTAEGHYDGSGADLTVYETRGGWFNQATETLTAPAGSLTLSFGGCGHGQVSYALDADGLHGGFAIQRLVPGSESVCLHRIGDATQATDINPGMSGAWYDPLTPGQGILLDLHSVPRHGNFAFLGWFTWGDFSATGQRWLTAQGPFEGARATLEIHETTGGSLNTSSTVETSGVGQLTLDFLNCNAASLEFTLGGQQGTVELTRLFPSGKIFCEQMSGSR